jgi:hypothetical protein
MSNTDSFSVDSSTPRNWLLQRFGLTAHGNYVVGMIKDAKEAAAASRELEEQVRDPRDVVHLPADEVARRIRRNGAGAAEDLLSEEGVFCADYDERALGSAIVSVYTHSGSDVARAYRILAAHDAHEIVYFADWTIRRLSRRDTARESR